MNVFLVLWNILKMFQIYFSILLTDTLVKYNNLIVYLSSNLSYTKRLHPIAQKLSLISGFLWLNTIVLNPGPQGLLSTMF